MRQEEEELKRLKLGVGCALLIVGLLLSATEDAFQKVINRQTDDEVASRLEEFRKEGMERNARSDSYDREKVITKAFSFLGTPARMGGISHRGIDCSGLVMMAHRSCDVKLPHSAEEQARYGAVISSIEKLQRGDIVFFYDSYATSKLITHSGIYLGEDEFIHTSSSKGVTVSRIDDPYYWKERFLFATRIGG